MGFPGSEKRGKFPVQPQWRIPDLELRLGEGRGGLFCLPCRHFFSSVIISLFSQTKGGGPGPHSGFAHVVISVLVFLHLVLSYFQSTFTESSRVESRRVYWNESLTTRSSRDESSTFCTLRHPSVLLPVSTISASACDQTSAKSSRQCSLTTRVDAGVLDMDVRH